MDNGLSLTTIQIRWEKAFFGSTLWFSAENNVKSVERSNFIWESAFARWIFSTMGKRIWGGGADDGHSKYIDELYLGREGTITETRVLKNFIGLVLPSVVSLVGCLR